MVCTATLRKRPPLQQMTQLGIFPHKLLQFKGYLANRTVDLDRGPDLLCRLSGEILKALF